MGSTKSQSQLAHLLPVLKQSNHFIIAGHVDPDADCIGSMLALSWALRKLGKSCLAVSSDPIPTHCAFLPDVEIIQRAQDVDPTSYQVLIVVDCEPNRTGLVAAWVDQFTHVINIDHHITNVNTAPLVWVDPEAGATGEMIYLLIKELGLQFNSDVATMLYTAVAGDTGFFRFSNTTARVMHIAAELLGYGVQPEIVSHHLNERHSWNYIQLLRRVLETLERTPDGKVSWIYISREMLDAVGMQWNETDGFVQYPRMLGGVEVALILREIEPNEIRVGLRSKSYVDVSEIAGFFGGGGHQRAAGCTIRLPFHAALQALLHKIELALEPSGKEALGD